MSEPDYAALKAQAARLWGLGEYPKIAAMILPAARSLVDACAISAGQEVLDVAAGTGNVAVLAAEEGADVTACDISPGQVELGRARTAAEGVEVDWEVADAEDLPYDDDRFDCSASVFGMMFAPRPEVAAAEMFRVVKPGGTIGIAAWGHFGVQAEIFEALLQFAPPPGDDVPVPRDWGDETIARQRLEPLASSVVTERRAIPYRFASFDEFWDVLGAAGPGAAMRNSMPADVLERAKAAVREIVDRHNTATDGALAADAEYLEIVARKRG